MTRPIQRRAIAEESSSVDFPLGEIDLDRVRRAYSDLFDRVALAVHRAGLDLDEIVVERWMTCRAGGTDGDAPVEGVSDADRLVAEAVRFLVGRGVNEIEARSARVVGLRCVAVLDGPTSGAGG